MIGICTNVSSTVVRSFTDEGWGSSSSGLFEGSLHGLVVQIVSYLFTCIDLVPVLVLNLCSLSIMQLNRHCCVLLVSLFIVVQTSRSCMTLFGPD